MYGSNVVADYSNMWMVTHRSKHINRIPLSHYSRLSHMLYSAQVNDMHQCTRGAQVAVETTIHLVEYQSNAAGRMCYTTDQCVTSLTSVSHH